MGELSKAADIYERKTLDTEITVSVIVITYNHSKYIKQCLDSILMQKTDFRYEVLVGDDASTDGTQEILLDYAERFPDVFRMVLREENLGPTRNAYDLFLKAKGKYLAHCEGDDYWTDDNKLQLQYELMESMPYLSACTHCVEWVNQSGVKVSSSYQYYEPEQVITLNNWNGIQPLGHTNSFFQRNLYQDSCHDYSIFISHPISGDLCSQLIALLQGDVLIISSCMAQYRRIVSKSGSNAISRMYSDPNFAVKLYAYWIGLENYCTNEFHVSKLFPEPKKAYYVAQMNKAFQIRNRETIKAFLKIFKLSNSKTEYVSILLKCSIRNFFRWIFSLPKKLYKGIRKRSHNDILEEFKALNRRIAQVEQKCNRAIGKADLLRVFSLRQEQMLIDLLISNGVELPESMQNILEIREKEKKRAEQLRAERMAAINQRHRDQLQETLEKYNLPPMPEEGCMIPEEERLAAKERVYVLLKC